MSSFKENKITLRIKAPLTDAGNRTITTSATVELPKVINNDDLTSIKGVLVKAFEQIFDSRRVEIELIENKKSLSLSEQEKEISIIKNFVNCEGCSFFLSRKFQKGKTCKEETGKGFDCFYCEAEYFLNSLGILPDRR